MVLPAVPLMTVAAPSFDPSRYLAGALHGIFCQGLPEEVSVADVGSTDNTQAVIKKWQHRLPGWCCGPRDELEVINLFVPVIDIQFQFFGTLETRAKTQDYGRLS
jgi:glycosyltransferase involved in cell wall biosynthesis